MGCDGGTIPKRHELVKGPKKVEKVDKNAALVARWYYCALTQEKLNRPVVSCDLGRLYNKDAVIEYLLDKSAERPNIEVAVHIRGIKDVKELNLTDNPAWQGDRGNIKGDRYEDLHRACYICPVVGLEMNGRHKFCYLRTCGCVFSERALREVKTEICHKCGDPFQNSDIVILNGSKEEVEELRKGMEERRAKEKPGKKSKKSKAAETVSKSEASKGKVKDNPGPSKTTKNELKTATVNKAEDSIASAPEPSTSTAVSIKPVAAAGSKRLFSGSDEKSEAYKSLFTSHSSAKRTKDQTSNWVTHTPYHF